MKYSLREYFLRFLILLAQRVVLFVSTLTEVGLCWRFVYSDAAHSAPQLALELKALRAIGGNNHLAPKCVSI